MFLCASVRISEFSFSESPVSLESFCEKSIWDSTWSFRQALVSGPVASLLSGE